MLVGTKMKTGDCIGQSAAFAADTDLHQVFADDELAGKVALRPHQVRARSMARRDVRQHQRFRAGRLGDLSHIVDGRVGTSADAV